MVNQPWLQLKLAVGWRLDRCEINISPQQPRPSNWWVKDVSLMYCSIMNWPEFQTSLALPLFWTDGLHLLNSQCSHLRSPVLLASGRSCRVAADFSGAWACHVPRSICCRTWLSRSAKSASHQLCLYSDLKGKLTPNKTVEWMSWQTCKEYSFLNSKL